MAVEQDSEQGPAINWNKLHECHINQGLEAKREILILGFRIELEQIYQLDAFVWIALAARPHKLFLWMHSAAFREGVVCASAARVCSLVTGWKSISKEFEDLFEASPAVNLAQVFKANYLRYLFCYEMVSVAGWPLAKALEEWRSLSAANGKKRGDLGQGSQKDEKYLQGGWQNRLILALKSHLPNEIDWAFNKLIKLSFLHHFFVGYLPGLSDALLDHAKPFFDALKLSTNPKDFETRLLNPAADNTLPTLSHITLFQSKEGALQLERVLQVLHIIRNMTFMHENAGAFSKDIRLLTMLAKAMTLAPSSYYMEVTQHALDIFENLAHHILLRGPADFFLAALKRHVYDTDRARIITSVKCLSRLTMVEKNERVMSSIDTALLQRMLQLLLVPDEEIVVVVLDYLYLFTNGSVDSGLRLATSVRFNILSYLFKFVHWRGQGQDVYRSTVPRLAPEKARTNTPLPPDTPKAPPPGLPPLAIDHFHAAMWLQTVCERDPSSSMSYEQFYEGYTTYCGKYDLNSIPQVELFKLITKMVSESAVSIQPPLVLGIKPRQEDDEASAQSMSSVDGPVAADEIRQGNYCGFGTCTNLAAFSSPEQLWEHVLTHNLTAGEWKQCPWHHCGQPVKAPAHLLNHIKTHIPVEPQQTPKLAAAPKKPKFPHMPNVPLYQHDMNDDLKGAPLTALLVIRNLARNPSNAALFSPWLTSLSALLTSTKYSKTVASIFAELKA
ncbi:Chromatin structure-remodeling complex protein rsc9 [Kappamyces sp. JEL0680]|nr:Chromatin structure-remodeling complex protein rsc9 [Kappamyces sp. JEL0680]